MYSKYLDFLYKPVEQEFFTKFVRIYSRDKYGNAVTVCLHTSGTPNSQLNNEVFYCDTILVGETLESAITRSLMNDFGLKLIEHDLLVYMIDTAKNRVGKPVSRFSVIAYVEYNQLKSNEVVGHAVSWVDRNKYLLDKSEPEALGWLEQNKIQTLLGRNKTTKTDDVIFFVNNLYAAGAVDITLGELDRKQEPVSEFKEEFNPDSLDIRLPKDVKARNSVLSVFNQGFNNIIPPQTKESDADRIIFYLN